MMSGIYFKILPQIRGLGWDRRNMIGKMLTVAELGNEGLSSLPLWFEKYRQSFSIFYY